MQNFESFNIGKLDEVDQYTFAPEGLPLEVPGKLFLKEPLGLTSMELSVNKTRPGTGMTFFHRHKQNEEVYIFIQGEGEMQIDDQRILVQEGTVVRVDPDARRAWWNTGTQDLVYFVIQGVRYSLKGASLEDGELLEGTVPWK